MGVLALAYSFMFVSVMLVGLFLQGFWLLVLGGLLFLVVWVQKELIFSEVGSVSQLRYPFAFWLFILTEAIVFFSLFVTSLWMDDGGFGVISDWMELPFLGCFFLLGSSVTATSFHYYWGLRESYLYLWLSVILGLCFVCLQGKEFYDCGCDLLSSSYSASSFCTVGLHFSHVVLGLMGFIFLFFVGLSLGYKGYVDYVVWYWHFVDYIWLLVFFFMYLP